MSLQLMATPKRKAKPGPKPDPGRVRSAVIQIRSMPAWKEWLKELADHDRADIVDVIDRALVMYAREIKFPKAAPKR